MIAPEQLRAARGLLDWTRQELAKASGVSAETIKNIEHGTFHASTDTTEKILKAFIDNGVEYISVENPSKGTIGIGVMLIRKNQIAPQESGDVRKSKPARRS